jgi:plastocyanin domain-containing protein
MEKSTFYGFAILLMIVGAGYFMVQGSSDKGVTGNVVAASGGDALEITLGMKGPNYYPDTISAKAGQPVRVNLDDTVYGCFRDFTIRDLGVRKYLANDNDFVEFVAEKPGTYTFACSMGMGFGKLVVE